MKLSRRLLVAGMEVLVLAAAGCSSSAGPAAPRASTPSGASPSPASPTTPPASTQSWAVATSAAAGGGLSALIAAARKEGALNVIALPPTWANYATIIKTFSKRYGIRVNAIAPGDASSQEISQIRQNDGTSSAADVLDIDMAVAVASSSLFAPYQVSTWAAIPASQKAPNGVWVQDYGGYMSVGYDSARFGTITSLDQLLKPKFANAVALDGNPAQAQAYAALSGVMMANLALGGTPSSITDGVAFFRKLKAAGNLVTVPATTPLTIKAGTTPVVFNWDYLNTPSVVGQPASTWKVFIPANAVVGDFYAQAINKDAPHPAAARLWQEFLYSQASDGGQNLWLRGHIRPVEQAAMVANGSIDAAASAELPPVPGPGIFLTPSQAASAARYLAANWP